MPAMTSTTTLLGCNLALLPSLLTCRRSSRPTSTATAISSRLPTFRTAGFRSNPRVVNVRSQSEGASGSPKTEDKKPNTEEEPTPSWAKAGSEELPPWARNEAAAPSKVESADLPFFVYLVASCLVAIAAVGSVFEYFNKNPVFGVIQPDNPLWAPILGFFAITGLPTAGFLWYKAIKLANQASEEADKADGFDR